MHHIGCYTQVTTNIFIRDQGVRVFLTRLLCCRYYSIEGRKNDLAVESPP